MVTELSGVQFGVKLYIQVISKLKYTVAVWVQFEITSMMSDQNCTTQRCHFISSIFYHLGKYQYFIDPVVNTFTSQFVC